MATLTFKKVSLIPLMMGGVMILGVIVTFVIAVLNKHVSPYVPYISEAGGSDPESGIFSLFLICGAILGILTMTIRFLIIYEINRGQDKLLLILNVVSLGIGFLSLVGMAIVASYPIYNQRVAHMIGANGLFVLGVVYAILQTIMSYKMHPSNIGITICHIRLGFTLICSISVITMLSVSKFANDAWGDKQNKNMKVPSDDGFALVLTSTVMEWILAIGFLSYFFTFIKEFGKVHFHIDVQPLVTHFDEDVGLENISMESRK